MSVSTDSILFLGELLAYLLKEYILNYLFIRVKAEIHYTTYQITDFKILGIIHLTTL